jgi:hypothetical protein
VQEEGRSPTPSNRLDMASKREFRSENEVTETEGQVSYGRIILWVIVGLAIAIGVVSYFRYAKLLPPLLG